MTSSREGSPTSRLAWTLLSMCLFAVPASAQEAAAPEPPAAPAAELPAATTAEPVPPPVADPRKGTVRGTVVSAASGEALIEARVSVEGTKLSVLTDVDGHYQLELAPGSYELRVFYELHQAQRIQGVVVEAGKSLTVDVPLRADSDAVLEVVIEATADRSRSAVQLEKRKRAAVVSDSVSGEEIGKTPDASAADAMKRVVGATLVDGKFVIIRGLGGRYSSTLLEGVPVPSPEPDVPALPLDLFPASLLSSVTVAKTASPDLPGNFAGGALLVDTRQYPSKFTLELRSSLSGDSESTFQDAPGYPGGSTDWLGYDDGLRGLPDEVPRDGPAAFRDDGLSRKELERIGESFDQRWSTEPGSLPPNFGLGAAIGDSISLFGRRLGYLAAGSYSRSFRRKLTEVQKPTVADLETGELRVAEEFVEEAGVRLVGLGALGSLAYQLAPGHELSLVSLYTRNAEDKAQLTTGFNDSDGSEFEATRLQFVARTLQFHQLRGSHRLDSARKAELSWRGNVALASRYEPDTRDLTYLVDGAGVRSFRDETGSGERFFGSLGDLSGGGGFDLSVPFEGVSPKLGALVTASSREFQSRRFRYSFNKQNRGADRTVLRLPPDELFSEATIGPEFLFEERTLPTDAYDANQDVLAGYAMVDVTLFDPVRFVGGARYELSHTILTAGSEFAIDETTPGGVDRRDADLLPSANVVYALRADANVRVAYAVTVARPQFRELAPFLYFDYTRRRSISGNPGLSRTRIQNGDLRLEWFPGPTEVVAVSLFGKYFEEPIEEVIQNENGDLGFDNAAAAQLYGAELEARIGLEQLAGALKNLGVTANLTLVSSRITLTDEQESKQTNKERPLQGQSPWVVNAGLRYAREGWGTEAQLLYNVFGPRIAEVAKLPFPDDVYEEPFHRLDVTLTQELPAGFDLKLSATNLLDSVAIERLADVEVSRYRPGVGASATLAWSN